MGTEGTKFVFFLFYFKSSFLVHAKRLFLPSLLFPTILSYCPAYAHFLA